MLRHSAYLISIIAFSLTSSAIAHPQPSSRDFAYLEKRFPDIMAQLAAECSSDRQLRSTVFIANEIYPRVSFTCWEPINTQGSRTGFWLGTLPLFEADTEFAETWACRIGDTLCREYLPQMRSRLPKQLRSAELQCAVKQGTLFINETDEAIELRCGYFATTLFDDNNDGAVDNEDPVSVDIAVLSMLSRTLK